MLDLRRSLIVFTAVATAAMVTLSAPGSTPVSLMPSVVEAYPELPPPDSLASLLVSPRSDEDFAVGPTRGETAYLLDVIATLDNVPERSGRVQALEEIALLPVVDSAVVAALARATRRLDRATNRVRVLDALIRHQPLATGRARGEVLDAIKNIRSESDRAAALETFIRRPGLDQRAVLDALAHAGALRSNVDRSRVLVAAARTQPLQGRVRTTYLRMANGMSSRYRSRALDALQRGSRSEEGS